MSHTTRIAHPLAVLSLAGDEAVMGAQHGAMVRELGGYEPALAFYPALAERVLAAGRRGAGRRLLLDVLRPLLAAGLARLDRARPEALRARTRAFMAALGRAAPHEDARHIMVLDVAQNAIGLLAKLGVAPDHPHLAQRAAAAFPGACSSFAVWGEASHDGRVLHGRNFDLPGIGVWEKQPVVAFCSPRDGLRYGFVTTRGADVPGVTAFNEAGLVLTAHTRFHRSVRFDGRGIVDLGHLIVQRARTVAEAIAIASAHPIASTWALFLSSAEERTAVSLEVHGERVAVVPPEPGHAWHVCTNRYRAPVMQRGEFAPSEAWVRYSNGREAVMKRALGHAARITPRDAMALLGRREAGDVPGWQRATGDTLCQSISIQSVVVDASAGRLWLGVGDAPSSLGPWREVPWRWGAPGATVVLGSEATSLTAEVPDAWPGFDDFLEASRLEGVRAPTAEVERALARAVAAAPDDPSYLHLLGGCALRAGRYDEAVSHLERAQVTERSDFRQGELRRWADVARRLARRRSRAPDLGVDFQLLTLSA